MSEQPTATARTPSTSQSKAAGKKYAGLSRNQWLIVGGVFAVALGYILWKRHEANAAAAAAGTTSAGSNECTDANGNPVDCSELEAQELAAIQNQLDGLESGGGGGGSTSTPPVTTGTGPGGTGPGNPQYPLNQTGTVKSATTGETGQVKTTDGGFTWTYDGAPPGKTKVAQNQTGTVTSATTGRSAPVRTSNGGETWTYAGVPSSA